MCMFNIYLSNNDRFRINLIVVRVKDLHRVSFREKLKFEPNPFFFQKRALVIFLLMKVFNRTILLKT